MCARTSKFGMVLFGRPTRLSHTGISIITVSEVVLKSMLIVVLALSYGYNVTN